MSMALAGVGFSFGMDTGGVSSALGKMEGKMASVADAFNTLRAQAVDSMFNAVEGGFSAVVKGSKALSSAMRGGLGKTWGAVTKIGSAFKNAGEFFGKYLGGPIMMFVGGAKKGFEILGNTLSAAFSDKALKSMTAGVNLTAGLEGEAVGTSKSVRELGANFGKTGKDLDKFTAKGTAMSMALNIGADQAAKALRGWNEAQSELQAMGFQSAESFAKFTAAFGVEADLLRNTGLQMRQEFGLTDEQIQNVIGSTAKMGQETGDVTSAMNGLPALMKNMRDQASLMGVEMDSGKLANFAAQTNALASGFMAISSTSDDAREKSIELATALVKSERQFEGMFSGTQSDLDEFTKELAISTGDVGKAFELMRSGPAGFVQGMIDMVAEAKKNGTLTGEQLDFVGLRLEKVLGDEASANLINVFRNADDAMLKAMTSTQQATNNLGTMAKEAFRTGRTMQDVFERASDSMFTRFRKLGKPAARKWLKDTQKAMKTFGDKVQDLGKDKGPLGQFVTKMSEASSIGAQALVPEALRPTTMVMGEMLEKFGPTLEALKGMGINFTSLSGIITTASTGLAVFAADMALNKKEGESWGDAAARTITKFKGSFVDGIKTVGSWLDQAATWFADFDLSKVFEMGSGEDATTEFGKAMASVRADLGEWATVEKWKEIAGKFGKGFASIWTSITENEDVRAGFDKLGTWIKDFLIDMVESIPWGTILTKIAEGIGSAAGAVWEEFTWENFKIGMDWGSDAEAAAERANKALDSVVDTAKENHGSSINTFAEHDMDKMVEVFETSAVAITDIMNNMFMDVTGNLDGVLFRVESTAAGIVDNLRMIGAMEEALVSGGGREMATPAQSRERDERISQMTSDEAVHSPLWYAGSQGYERLFTAKMDSLIAAVGALQRTTAPTADQRQAEARSRDNRAPATSRARVPASVRG